MWRRNTSCWTSFHRRRPSVSSSASLEDKYCVLVYLCTCVLGLECWECTVFYQSSELYSSWIESKRPNCPSYSNVDRRQVKQMGGCRTAVLLRIPHWTHSPAFPLNGPKARNTKSTKSQNVRTCRILSVYGTTVHHRRTLVCKNGRKSNAIHEINKTSFMMGRWCGFENTESLNAAFEHYY